LLNNRKVHSGRRRCIGDFASNYKFTNLAIGKRQLFDIPGIFIPIKTLFTSVAGNLIEEAFGHLGPG